MVDSSLADTTNLGFTITAYKEFFELVLVIVNVSIPSGFASTVTVLYWIWYVTCSISCSRICNVLCSKYYVSKVVAVMVGLYEESVSSDAVGL